MTVQLHARDVGAGTPLVLLHAFPLSSAMWLEQREGLAGRFRVITPDLRGFGGSRLGDDPPSIDRMADDVALLIRRLGLDGAVVAGLSMGGYVAMALCRRHPDLVLGLVLASTKASADTDQARRNRLRQADALDRDDDVNVLLDEVLPNLVGPTTFQQRALVYGRVRGLVQATPAPAAAWAQRAMAGRPASFDTLRGLTVPALVVSGDEDPLSTGEDARAMVEALPDAEPVVIPQAGHLCAIERPDLFNRAVGEFTATLARASR
ncbi:alpha/beta fold hydrolase [Actinomadura viridis]|uniref:Pimeloyl-ACP methyl ester carboxylesterase n=1 Tax=Actinomadura viridis TaxID=58110 RepID=A0A931DB72_9ACTN|nr:alpha/beta hydrolase [Actinomadura viridis]MBG6086965.1 pimeloyl-ACP methyl ester carboxylesterase [Actinomadura viridis]